MKYLIAIDSDGTLRKNDGTITEKTKLAIKKQIGKGNIVVICTARPRYHTLEISEDVGISNYLISSNGSEVFDIKENKIIWSSYIDKEKCKLLYEYANKNNIRIMFVLDNSEYVTEFTRNDNQILLNDENFNDVFESNVKQIMAIDKDKEKIDEFKKIVKSKYKMNILDSSNKKSEESWFSIISNNASKGIALKKISEYLNIPIENTIAIGNDRNDISMFEIAGVSVAVNNASKSIKNKVDYVTLSNEKDGVATFLNTYKK